MPPCPAHSTGNPFDGFHDTLDHAAHELLVLAFVPPLQSSAQEGEFVYISNVTGTQAGGAGAALASVAEQTAIAPEQTDHGIGDGNGSKR